MAEAQFPRLPNFDELAESEDPELQALGADWLWDFQTAQRKVQQRKAKEAERAAAQGEAATSKRRADLGKRAAKVGLELPDFAPPAPPIGAAPEEREALAERARPTYGPQGQAFAAPVGFETVEVPPAPGMGLPAIPIAPPAPVRQAVPLEQMRGKFDGREQIGLDPTRGGFGMGPVQPPATPEAQVAGILERRAREAEIAGKSPWAIAQMDAKKAAQAAKPAEDEDLKARRAAVKAKWDAAIAQGMPRRKAIPLMNAEDKQVVSEYYKERKEERKQQRDLNSREMLADMTMRVREQGLSIQQVRLELDAAVKTGELDRKRARDLEDILLRRKELEQKEQALEKSLEAAQKRTETIVEGAGERQDRGIAAKTTAADLAALERRRSEFAATVTRLMSDQGGAYSKDEAIERAKGIHGFDPAELEKEIARVKAERSTPVAPAGVPPAARAAGATVESWATLIAAARAGNPKAVEKVKKYGGSI